MRLSGQCKGKLSKGRFIGLKEISLGSILQPLIKESRLFIPEIELWSAIFSLKIGIEVKAKQRNLHMYKIDYLKVHEYLLAPIKESGW